MLGFQTSQSLCTWSFSIVVMEELGVTEEEAYKQKTQYVLTLLRQYIPDFNRVQIRLENSLQSSFALTKY